jgi:membrane associated rhomboid family serine protease
MIRMPGPGRPVLTYTLIVACCLVFVLGPGSGLGPAGGSQEARTRAYAAVLARWGVVPETLWNGPGAAWLTPLTALFVHGDWPHLLGNMVFLYVFGAMAEERMGRLHFALFYLGAGYLALLGYAMAHADSDQALIGASGAVSGVLGAFLRLFPSARVTALFPVLLFLPLRLPAWVVLPLWFGVQWLAAHRAGDASGVAYLAHLVGFALGFGYAWVRFGRAARVSGAAGSSQGERQS